MARTHTTGRPQGILYSLVCLLVLGVSTVLGGAGDTPRQGGTLRVAPVVLPTLDPYWRDLAITWTLARHYLESLYTFGKDGGPIPMLAEGHTVSDDGLVYTFTLRRGVLFHHGKELTAADVVASLQRWAKMVRVGEEFFTRVASLMPLDKYTVQVRLTEKSALVLAMLNTALIYPQEVMDAAGEGEVKTIIGTGPFQLAEHEPGRMTRLVRFAQYKARPEPPNGHGGGKTAWVDTLVFLPMPDAATHVAAVESGEADVILGTPLEAYDRLKNHPDLKVLLQKDYNRVITLLNKKHGMFTNVTLRQAVLAALDMDAVLRAAFGRPEFYRLDASPFPKDSLWWTDVGRERYNQQDKDKAQRLLHEAGYQGEPLRYLTTGQGGSKYKVALATQQQLEAVGFNVALQVVDNVSTLMHNPDLWDACAFGSLAGGNNPYWYQGLRCEATGGWNCDPDVVRLKHIMATELRFEQHYRLWQDLQRLFWERIPVIHYGYSAALQVMRKHVHGPFDMGQLYFWNVWVEK